MAILWQKTIRGTRYEVRSHGATRRLLTDGVFHSAWNMRAGLTGRAWDLFLPAAFAAAERPARVLLLGVGAGTALLQLRRFLDPRLLVGVELDPVHLDIGRRYFGLEQAGARIIQADARAWVTQWSGRPFDLVIDDLYGQRHGEPERAVPVDAAWARRLVRLVSPGGVLAANFVSRAALARADGLDSLRRDGFASGFRVEGPRDDNAVAVVSRERVAAARIRTRMRAWPGLDDQRGWSRLGYTIRALW